MGVYMCIISVSQDHLACFSCILIFCLAEGSFSLYHPTLTLSLSLSLLPKPIRWLVVGAKKKDKIQGYISSSRVICCSYLDKLLTV